jgi:tetratricopeptide (TPR) repeat protein
VIVITANDTTADTLYATGHWLLGERRYEDAKHVFRTLIVLAPMDERSWLGLGACHEGTHELDKAARLYTLAPQACASALRCLVALARVLRRLERDDESADAYAKAAELAVDLDEGELVAIIATEGTSS